jgi:hypothetical protein
MAKGKGKQTRKKSHSKEDNDDQQHKETSDAQSKYWVTEPDQEIDIRMEKDGFGAEEPLTVIDILRDTVENHGDEHAMAIKRPVKGKIPDEWKYWTWNDYYHDAEAFAKSLISLNIEAHHMINILGFNSVRLFIWISVFFLLISLFSSFMF